MGAGLREKLRTLASGRVGDGCPLLRDFPTLTPVSVFVKGVRRAHSQSGVVDGVGRGARCVSRDAKTHSLRRMRRPRLVLVALAIAAASAAMGAGTGHAQDGGKVVRLPLPQYDGTLTPYSFELAYPLVNLVYDTLMWRDAKGTPQPWLARSVSRENGGRRYIVRLRPGLRWHDGRPLTAADVAFTFDFVRRRFHPRFTPQLENVASGPGDRPAHGPVRPAAAFLGVPRPATRGPADPSSAPLAGPARRGDSGGCSGGKRPLSTHADQPEQGLHLQSQPRATSGGDRGWIRSRCRSSERKTARTARFRRAAWTCCR